MDQQHIDELLKRYLGLLDEYTRIRQELSHLQSEVYHNIARANFCAERGLRYGQDHFDDRMQASRLLSVGQSKSGAPVFTVGLTKSGDSTAADTDAGAGSSSENHRDKTEDDGGDDETGEGEGESGEKRQKVNNPLHWFGIFVPPPLRTAQSQSIEVVEDTIPKLASIAEEMHAVEIEIGRARKRRAKALATDKKIKENGLTNTSQAQVTVGASEAT